MRKLPTFAVSVTLTLLDTFTKLAVAKLPKLAFSVTILPLKLAVLPLSSKLTVKLLVVTLLDTFTKLAVAKLPKLAFREVRLPLKLATLPKNVLVTFALPNTVKF